MIKKPKNLNKFRISWNFSQWIWGSFFWSKKRKRWIIYQVWHISANPHLRIKFLLFFILVIFWIIVSRLFFLQIVKWDYYKELAFEQQYSKIIIPARRWEIFATNSKTWEKQKLATNVSLDLVYIDPNFIKNKEEIAKKLADILFTEEDYKNCKNDIKTCPRWSTVKFDDKVTVQPKPVGSYLLSSWWSEATEGSKNTKSNITIDSSAKASEWQKKYKSTEWQNVLTLKDTRSMEELKRDYADDILRKISKKWIDYLPLKYWASDEEIKKVKEIQFPWLEILPKSKIIYLDPTKVDQTKIKHYAKILHKIFPDKKLSQLELFLKKRRVQYINYRI